MAELALSKSLAQEEIGRIPEALQVLSNYILSIQPTKWTKYDEEVGLRYVKLSADLRNDNLLQKHLACIRNSCQNIEPEVMEHIADSFIDHITRRISDATASLTRSQSPAPSSTSTSPAPSVSPSIAAAAAASGFDPNTCSDEEYLLYLATGASSLERGGAAHVKPLQDYLVRVYRALLEVFKQNNIYVSAYRRYSEQAIEFCIREDRPYDIREMFKSFTQYHLEGVMEPRFITPVNVSLADPAARADIYAVFAKFFDGAMALSRWNEVRNIAKATQAFLTDPRWTAPAGPAVADYYKNLATFFWAGRNILLHSFALKKVFVATSKDAEESDDSSSRREELATAFALAALAAPVQGMPPTGSGSGCALTAAAAAAAGMEGAATPSDHTRDYARDYALTMRPTRAQALQDLVGSGALAAAAPEARELYEVLEGGFAEPAGICRKVGECVRRVGERFVDLKSYATGLRRVALFRTLEQCAQAYDVLRIPSLVEMAQATKFAEIRPLVLEFAKARVVRMTVDHARGVITFPRETASNSVTSAIRAVAVAAAQIKEPVNTAINASEEDSVDEKAVEEQRQRALEAFRAASESRERRTRYREARARRAELIAKQLETQRELEEIERQGRIREEEERRKRREEEERAKIRIRLGAAGAGEVEDTDPEALLELYKKHKAAEKKRREKLRLQEEAVADANHYERARRTEEVRAIRDSYERECVESRKEYDAKREETLRKAREDFEKRAEDKKLFARMTGAAEEFRNAILADRKAAFDAVHGEWEARRKAAHDEWEKRESEARAKFEEEEEERRKKWEAEEAEKKNRYVRKTAVEGHQLPSAATTAAASTADSGDSWRSKRGHREAAAGPRDSFLDDLLGGGSSSSSKKREEENVNANGPKKYVPPGLRGGKGAESEEGEKKFVPSALRNKGGDAPAAKEGAPKKYVPPGLRRGADEGAGAAPNRSRKDFSGPRGGGGNRGRDNVLDDLLYGGSSSSSKKEEAAPAPAAKEEETAGAGAPKKYVPPTLRNKGGDAAPAAPAAAAPKKDGAYKVKKEMPKGKTQQGGAAAPSHRKGRQPEVDEDGFVTVGKGRRGKH